jgi:hypothetical protein
MKYLALLAVICTLGCSTTVPERCEKYNAAYNLYKASAAVRDVSKDEITAASSAAAFLQIYCGWTTVKSKTRGGSRGPLMDDNGVPIIQPPQQ